MALYLGDGQKRRIYLDGKFYKIHIANYPPLEGVILLPSDDKALKDANGYYLTAKMEGDEYGE